MGLRFRKIALCVVISCLLFGGTSEVRVAHAAQDFDIQRMIQEAPGFSLYGNASGIVWLKDHQYALLADGSMESTVTWVILARSSIDPRWLNWAIPVPEGGNVDVIAADIYDPGTGLKELEADTSFLEVGENKICQVQFPVRDEMILALSYKVLSPGKVGVDGYIKTGLDLPQWEQRISVDVPSGANLAWISSEGIEPSVEKVGGRDQYKWLVVNHPTWSGRSLLSSFEPFIAFSLQQGRDSFYRLLKAMEGVSTPNAPEAVSTSAKNANKVKAGNEIIRYVKNIPSFPVSVPAQALRSSIPAEGPWSDWEKTIVLSRWLPLAGWQTRIKWVTATEIAGDTPVTKGLLLKPVIEASYPGAGVFFFDLQQGISLGETPPALWGNRVYGLVDQEIKTDVIQGGGAADHRLSLRWNMTLNESGVLSGKVSFFVRNGWTGLFFGGDIPDGPKAADVLSACTGVPFDGKKAEIRQLKYGYEISFPIEILGAITGATGQQMLVKLPSFFPMCLKEIGGVRPPYSLRFPFAVEMEYDLRIPSTMDVVMLPGTASRDMGKVKYYEKIDYRQRKNLISGSAKVVVSVDRIDESIASALNESVRRFADFNAKTLPLRAK
ncbi:MULTISPECIES: hypothetical protein [Aminobacterium]|jgi:hypothetical protein|uniref:hypothetical protein n=1 Tax=Aminobacterium TaxID=81466 RepID=UPI00257C8E35|nr:hypothetical protein [Aminobacterium sp. UBA4834]